MSLGATLAQFPVELTEKARETVGLFLTGKNGRGKTYFAAAVIRDYLERVDSVFEDEFHVEPREVREILPVMVSVPELMLELQATNDRNRTADEATMLEALAKYTDTPLLVLDDLGAEKLSEFTALALYVIIDKRWRTKLRTIVTSNLDLEGVALRFSGRIASRLAGMCQIIKFAGSDRRLSR